jgi:hypothetical protein
MHGSSRGSPVTPEFAASLHEFTSAMVVAAFGPQVAEDPSQLRVLVGLFGGMLKIAHAASGTPVPYDEWHKKMYDLAIKDFEIRSGSDRGESTREALEWAQKELGIGGRDEDE